MNDSLRTAVVAGGSKGIGFDIARRLYLSGINVVVAARNVSHLTDAERQWNVDTDMSKRGRFLSFSVDARDDSAVIGFAKNVHDIMGSIDILVNSIGGVTKTGRMTDPKKENILNAKDWSDCFDHNVLSMVNCCQAFYPFLLQSKTARIVNISSVTGVEPGDFNPHYSACKAATINFSKHLAGVWAENNILVNSISVGSLDSNALHHLIENKAKTEQRDYSSVKSELVSCLSSRIPLGRLGRPEDVSIMAELLVSKDMSWLTGANICLDGGKHRSML